MQTRENVRTNLNMQKFLGQREGGSSCFYNGPWMLAQEQLRFGIRWTSACARYLQVQERPTKDLERLDERGVKRWRVGLGWAWGGLIWHIRLHAPVMHWRAKDVLTKHRVFDAIAIATNIAQSSSRGIERTLTTLLLQKETPLEAFGGPQGRACKQMQVWVV